MASFASVEGRPWPKPRRRTWRAYCCGLVAHRWVAGAVPEIGKPNTKVDTVASQAVCDENLYLRTRDSTAWPNWHAIGSWAISNLPYKQRRRSELMRISP